MTFDREFVTFVCFTKLGEDEEELKIELEDQILDPKIECDGENGRPDIDFECICAITYQPSGRISRRF